MNELLNIWQTNRFSANVLKIYWNYGFDKLFAIRLEDNKKWKNAITLDGSDLLWTIMWFRINSIEINSNYYKYCSLQLIQWFGRVFGEKFKKKIITK